ncbi:hypothetical protein F5878DRAFT_653062 [Lentinula raphanica]|uniref:Uncharacterized protein n=1 Tax=Lentinula raphanica TaxID=153919 RepID=A0AA38P543_9AGAR|nr:hypothetical protein F5880DRAFT_1622479 [Lentinula raphanica]KAJ3836513.1 hypothetical protein F5878DRAFT_653062 [Lentinula raphanica]
MYMLQAISMIFFCSLGLSFRGVFFRLQWFSCISKISGEMEATIVKTMARTANLRRWLRRPDCPESVRQLKILFDKAFMPVTALRNVDQLVEMKGTQRAYVKFDKGYLSPVGTHAGNSNIIYRRSPGESPVAGQIQSIQNVHTDGQNTGVRFYVRSYNAISVVHDPFDRFIHFPARTYSSTLGEAVDVIELDDIVAHAARYDYSYGRSVLVNLSRQ